MDLSAITNLRQATGAGVSDCKKALEQAGGDFDKAVEELRKKGEAKAAKKSAERQTKEGVVVSYIHSNKKLGVLLELLCETDFVARTEDFQALAYDLAMHVAAIAPDYVKPENVPADVVAKEKEIYSEQMASENKPADVLEKILDGKINKFFDEVCLINQKFIKDEDKTIEQLLTAITAKTGEKVEVGNFVRFQI